MSDFDVMLALLEKQGKTARDNENSGRLAFSMHTVETRGLGQIRHAPVLFEVVFLQEPVVVSGSSVGKVSGEVDPIATSCIRYWQRNGKGHYIGFVPVFRVDLYLTASPNQNLSQAQEQLKLAKIANSCTMVHNFMFAGQAYKELGEVVRKQAASTPVREVDY